MPGASFLLAFLGNPVTPAHAKKPPASVVPQEVPLAQGAPEEAVLARGETHVYTVELPADQVVSGVVDQRGADVVVRVLAPSGAVVAVVDGPTGDAGDEAWLLSGEVGRWRIEVTPFGQDPDGGAYEVRIDEVLTADVYAERLAARVYRSPRLLRLWREVRAEGDAAVERFATELEGHAPLVEPVPDDEEGDVFVTFVRRVPRDVPFAGIIGGPNTVGIESPLFRFEDTDLRYATMRAPRESRFSYGFRYGEPIDPFASFDQLMALAPPELDPWNTISSAGMSYVELPAAPAQPLLVRAPEVPAGRVVRETVHSEILGEDRAVGVYLPASYSKSKGPYPYVIVFDGEVYGLTEDAYVPTPVILDNLVAAGELPPMIAVLVESGGTRDRDLPMSTPFAEFLARELAPWVQREYRGAADPAQVTLAGSSFGGLCAAYVAFHHPDVFGNVLSQSGSFWFAPGALTSDAPLHLEPGALMREVLNAPPKPVRFWMEVGLFEGGGPGLPGMNQLAQNRHLRDVLLAKGYAVTYREFSGGHDYANWRGSLGEGLVTLKK